MNRRLFSRHSPRAGHSARPFLLLFRPRLVCVCVCVCVCVRGQLFICFVDGRRQLLSLRLRRTKGAATGPSFTAHTFPRLPLVPRWVTCSTHNNNNDDDDADDDDGKQKNQTQNGTGRQNNNKHSAITRPSFPFAGYPLPPTDQSHSDE